MGKKCKERVVCAEPGWLEFGPLGVGEEMTELIMTVDELEAIRLIDLENLSQEACARHMRVARTTAQLIYNRARKKMAEALVYGIRLRIEGGNYSLCKGENPGCSSCKRFENIQCICILKEKESGIMRIAVTYENGKVFQHFGRTETFKVYEVKEDCVISSEIIGTNGQGHGALAGVLAANQIDMLICGGIGGGAQNALKQAGIELCAGASGSADQAVSDFLSGKLINTGSNCNHHHEEGHSCGNHGCGTHNCDSHK